MEDLANYPGLFRRKSIWYVRKRVPQDVVEMYKSDNLKVSLQTSDLAEAKQRYHAHMLEFQADFTQKRLQKTKQAEDDQLSAYSDHDILGLAYRWHRELTEHWDAKNKANLGTQYDPEDVEDAFLGLKIEKHECDTALKTNDYSYIYGSASAWLEKKGIGYQIKSQAFLLFCQYMLKALSHWHGNNIKAFKGQHTQALEPAIFTSIEGKNMIGQKPVLLTDLLKRFLKQDERKKLTDKTNAHYHVVVDRLNLYAGEKLYVGKIKRSFLEDYRNALKRYPARIPPKLKNASFEEIIAYAEKNNLQRMSVGSINTHIHNLHALLEYAYLNDMIVKNPVQKLALSDETADKSKRDPWTVKQLSAIFEMPLFQGHYKSRYDEAIKWFCLISLWEGLSKKEISQIQPQDVSQEDGVWVLNVMNRPEAGAKLKTEYRERCVPIHKKLIDCGFLQFVESRKKNDWLFHELTTDSINGKSHYIGKRFGEYVSAAGISEGKTSFHSFRHNFRDALRDTEMDKNIQHALGGWSTGEKATVADSYGKGYSVTKLNENLQKIAYPGLDLSHIQKL